MTGFSTPNDRPLSPSTGSGGSDDSGDAMIAMLKDRLSVEQQARRKAEEVLRETHPAMIKHQQIGRMADFRYNTRMTDRVS
jgi:hypothetical protein